MAVYDPNEVHIPAIIKTPKPVKKTATKKVKKKAK